MHEIKIAAGARSEHAAATPGVLAGKDTQSGNDVGLADAHIATAERFVKEKTT